MPRWRHRVVAASAPGMTAAKTHQSQPAAFDQAMPHNRLRGIGRTSGIIAARRRQQWGNKMLIKADRQDANPPHADYQTGDAHCSIRFKTGYNSARASLKPISAAVFLATATICIPARGNSHSLKHSRNMRFTRLRTTALPTLRETAIPKRRGSSGLKKANTIKRAL